MFERNALVGLLSMDLLLMHDYLLLLPIYLALWVALRHRAEGPLALGVFLALVTVPIYFASNPALEMLSLSGKHAAASTEEARAFYAAAGQALVETYQGTAFHVSYVVGSSAGTLLSVAMLRSPAFGRVAGWAGILGYVVGLGLYIPDIGLLLSVLSGPMLWVWYLLLARGFCRLARGGEGQGRRPASRATALPSPKAMRPSHRPPPVAGPLGAGLTEESRTPARGLLPATATSVHGGTSPGCRPLTTPKPAA